MDFLKTLEPVYRGQNFVILDTETTGVNEGSEIIEIAVINQAGEVLINTRVKPKGDIPPGATLVHGIQRAHVENSPTWDQIRQQVHAALNGKKVIIYNRDYDTKLLRYTDAVYQFKDAVWESASYYCAMMAYAELRGEWNSYRKGWKWHKLTVAMEQQGLPVKDAHGALGDCLMTLALLGKMYP